MTQEQCQALPSWLGIAACTMSMTGCHQHARCQATKAPSNNTLALAPVQASASEEAHVRRGTLSIPCSCSTIHSVFWSHRSSKCADQGERVFHPKGCGWVPLQGHLSTLPQRSQSLGLSPAQLQPTTQQTHLSFLHGSQNECASANALPHRSPIHPTQTPQATYHRLHDSTSNSRSLLPLALQLPTRLTAASPSLCCTGCEQQFEGMRTLPWMLQSMKPSCMACRCLWRHLCSPPTLTQLLAASSSG